MQACYRGGLKSPRIVQEGLNEATILSLVATGLGVGWVIGTARWRSPETIVIIPVVDLDMPLALSLVWRRDNTSPLLANFISEVQRLPGYEQSIKVEDSVQRISHVETYFAATGANVVHGGSRACYVPSTDNIHKPCIDFFGMQRAITPHAPTKTAIELATLPGSTANSGASASATKVTQWKSLSPNLVQPSFPPTSN